MSRVKKISLNGQGPSTLFRETMKTLRSGYVSLNKDQEVGRHTTAEYEEMLLFLEGRGKVITESEEHPVEAQSVVYIPPFTEHNVVATSPRLRYVYVVSPAKV